MSIDASARAARSATARSATRRYRLSVPTAQAAPKMNACTIASYGWLCPGCAWDQAMPAVPATTVSQRSSGPLRSATVANAIAGASGSGAYPNWKAS